MEIKGKMVKLDKPTFEIHVYLKGQAIVITKVKQDKLNRTYINIEVGR